jgi:hypothetical protein
VLDTCAAQTPAHMFSYICASTWLEVDHRVLGEVFFSTLQAVLRSSVMVIGDIYLPAVVPPVPANQGLSSHSILLNVT